MINEEKRKELRQNIQDILGYPFYVNSIEVNVLPDKIDSICDDIIDLIFEVDLYKIPYSILEQHLKERKEEAEEHLKWMT